MTLSSTFLLSCVALLQEPQDPDQDLPRPKPPGESLSRGREAPLATAPSAVTVIPGDELRSTGVRFLSDALRLVPGFEVTRSFSTESAVNARGFNDDSSTLNGILGVVDGRQVYNDFFGNVLWDALPVPIESIERIEVIRGPGSFLYGPNAMHGIVNIITKSPLAYAEDTILVSGSGGLRGSDMASAIIVRRAKEDPAAIKLTIAWDDIEDFSPRGANARDKIFVEARYERRFGENIVGLTGVASRQKLDTLIPTFLGVPATLFASDVVDLTSKVDWSNGPYKAYLSWDHFRSDSIPGALYAPFSLLLDTVSVDALATFGPFGPHTLTAGTGYRYTHFSTDDADISDGAHATNLAWVHLQDEFAPLKELVVTGGVRLDRHSLAGPVVSPRLAVVWEAVQERVWLRASGGYGFRQPALREFWFRMPVNIAGLPPAEITGDRDLRPEQMRSLELACHATPADRLRVEAGVFYNLVDRGVSYVATSFLPSPPFPAGIPSTIGPSGTGQNLAYGMEAEVNYRFREAGWVFANGSFSERFDRDTHDRIAFAPRWKASAGVTLGGEDQVQGMAWVSFFDDVEFAGGRVPQHALVNGRISVPFTVGESRGRLFVEGFNLLNRVHRETPDGDEYGILLSAGVSVRW